MLMRRRTSSGQQQVEQIRSAHIGIWHLELLPRAPYEARYTPNHSIIGFSFDSQVGSHAFATDRSSAFRASPNGLAYVPAGCDVYSQSTTGGEYLKVVSSDEENRRPKIERRFSDVVDKAAIDAAFVLRRALLSGVLESLLNCEHALIVLESCVAATLGDSSHLQTAKKWMTGRRLKQVDDIIEERIDTQLSVTDIAVEFELSPGYFSREFKKAVGRSPHQYIVDKRLGHARHLLQQSRQDLSSIAFACGFASHSHMSEQFRIRLGISPGKLRSGLRTLS